MINIYTLCLIIRTVGIALVIVRVACTLIKFNIKITQYIDNGINRTLNRSFGICIFNS